MKKGLTLGFMFPLLACAMENGLSIDAVGKQLDMVNILKDAQKKPTEKMDSVHAGLVSYLQQKRDNGCNMFFCKGLAALLNDAACEALTQENKAIDLRDYWSNGSRYQQSVLMKIGKD
jgi:hypothetical protein